jgi:hypothetical protein
MTRNSIGNDPSLWPGDGRREGRSNPPTVQDLARLGLLWTGAQHEALKTPPSENIRRRLDQKQVEGDAWTQI